MKTDIQTKLKTLFDEKIKNRKAMFIPIAGVAAFMLVGYAGVDHENPEIVSSHIQIPYGEKFDTDAIDVVDNHDRSMVRIRDCPNYWRKFCSCRYIINSQCYCRLW